jgi:RNA polymerase sigma factor (sigma-70 family)
MQRDDLLLLQRWRDQRDAEAFDTLVTRHAGMVFAACRRILRNASDAEDVTQECFLKLAQSGDRVTTSLGGWLHRVATHQALNRLKQNQRRSIRERSFVEVGDKTDVAAWNDVQSHVDEALEQLAEPMRELVIAHFLNRQTHEEIAAERSIPRRTVSHRIQRGVDHIRDHLESRGVRVGTTALTGAMTATAADAAPPALTAALGRLAIAGAASPMGTATTSVLGVALLMKAKLTVAAIAIITVAGISFLTFMSGIDDPPLTPVADIEIADQSLITPITESEARTPEPTPPLAESSDIHEEVVALTSSEPGWIADPINAISISGYVVDDTGDAISDALVEVSAMGFAEVEDMANDWNTVLSARTDTRHNKETRSDRNGEFRIEGIRYAGFIALSATQDGFAASQNEPAVIDLEPGSDKRDVLIVLSPATHRLHGRVVEKGSRRPVTDAQILILNAMTSGSRTDAKGMFSMHFLEAKMISLQVVSEKFGRTTFPSVSVGGPEIISLEIPKAAIVTGIITEHGSPAPSVQVKLQGEWSRDEYTAENVHYGRTGGLGFSYTTRTNIDGSYEFTEIDPGQQYEIYLLNARGERLSRRGELGELQPGSETIWDYDLETLTTVHGTVYGSKSGQPLTDVYVDVYKVEDGNRFFQAETQVAPDGSYEIRFAASEGMYHIIPNYGPVDDGETASGENVLLTPGDTKAVDLSLLDPWTIKARIVDSDGAPLDVTDIMVNTHNRSVQVLRTPDQDGNISWASATPGVQMWLSMSALGYTKEHTPEFTGTPGDVFDAGDIVLYKTSAGIQGVASTASDGIVANESIRITAHYGSNDATKTLRATTNDLGQFVIMDGIPVAPSYFSIQTVRNATQLTGETDYISINDDTVTHIGQVILE